MFKVLTTIQNSPTKILGGLKTFVPPGKPTNEKVRFAEVRRC